MIPGTQLDALLADWHNRVAPFFTGAPMGRHRPFRHLGAVNIELNEFILGRFMSRLCDCRLRTVHEQFHIILAGFRDIHLIGHPCRFG